MKDLWDVNPPGESGAETKVLSEPDVCSGETAEGGYSGSAQLVGKQREHKPQSEGNGESCRILRRQACGTENISNLRPNSAPNPISKSKASKRT